MSGQLKPPQREQRHEIADVQAVGRRIETGVERERALRQPSRQRLAVRAIRV